MDSPADKEEKEEAKKPKKKKSQKKGGSGTKPQPVPKKPNIDQPVHLSQQEQDEGWGVVVQGRKKGSSKTKPQPKKSAPASSARSNTAAPVAKVPDGNANVEVRVDSRKLGVIIGPGGATIKSIQEATGTRVELPDRDKGEETSGPVMVTISGPADGVAKAKRTIEDLSKKGYSSLTEGGNFTEGAISVPHASVSELIGKRGVIIKAIQDTMEVRLNFPDTKNQELDGFGRPKKKTVKVGIAGDKAKVAKAKQVRSKMRNTLGSTANIAYYSDLSCDNNILMVWV